MIVVIGAGYAGLTAAALLSHAGKDVLVLESHDTLGGCAGMFRSGSYTFDVGATTFSGLHPQQPVGRVFTTLGLTPRLVQQDPGMIIRMKDADVPRHASHAQWVNELSAYAPGGDLPGFWDRLAEIESRVWQLITAFPALPPSNAREWLSLAHPRGWRHWQIARGLVTSMASLARSYGIPTTGSMADLLNEQLMISTQSTLHEAPFTTGAMGLTYPSAMFYPVGGMVAPAIQLLRSITAHGGMVKFRRRVERIELDRDGYVVTTSRGERVHANAVISSVPVWNMAALTSGPVRRYFEGRSAHHADAWCAITVYFALDKQPMLPTAYYQVHLDAPIPFVHSGSVFLTISRPDDTDKAPIGHATVTVSTHGRAADWQGLSESAYRERKALVQQAILALLDRRMPEFDGSNRFMVDSGTPITWINYTSRYNGYVGGIPHRVRQPLLTMPPNRMPFRGLYHIGDTAFPGQGIPSVMHGASTAAYLCMHE